MRPNLIRRTALGIGILAAPIVFAVAGAGQAAADPNVCASGPFGYVSACLNVPVPWWYNGPPNWHDNGWHNGWYNGHGHGHDD